MGYSLEIDVDGVLLDLWSTFFNDRRFVYASTAEKLDFVFEDIKTYAMKELTYDKLQLAYRSFADAMFMSHLHCYPDTLEGLMILAQLCQQGVISKVYINTLVSNTEVAEKRKIQLETLLVSLYGFYELRICVGKKTNTDADICIEDNPYCFFKDVPVLTYKRAYLVNRPYNVSAEICNGVVRCNSFKEAVKAIQQSVKDEKNGLV